MGYLQAPALSRVLLGVSALSLAPRCTELFEAHALGDSRGMTGHDRPVVGVYARTSLKAFRAVLDGSSPETRERCMKICYKFNSCNRSHCCEKLPAAGQFAATSAAIFFLRVRVLGVGGPVYVLVLVGRFSKRSSFCHRTTSLAGASPCWCCCFYGFCSVVGWIVSVAVWIVQPQPAQTKRGWLEVFTTSEHK